ncbi:MAG: hypothetical protein K2J96_02555, partial [Bacteroidaceae bacterium]|nr:hypothetical protein [Bacteroidaceae bacterium]
MKKILFTFMLAINISNSVKAQVLKEIHTFNSQITINMDKIYGDEIPDADCYYGSEFSKYNNTVTFYVYNADFTQRLYKQVSIPERTGEKIYSVVATQRIINDDDKYELFVITTKEKAITTAPTNFNAYMRCIIYDEEGNKLQDLGTAYNWVANPSLHFTQGECRMSMMYYTLDSDNTLHPNTAIYRVNNKDSEPSDVRAISSEDSSSYLRWDSQEAIDLSGRRVSDGYSSIRIMNGRKYIK